MYINEETHYKIERVMSSEGLDYDAAKEFLEKLIEDHDLDFDPSDYEERIGCGDCFGDAL